MGFKIFDFWMHDFWLPRTPAGILLRAAGADPFFLRFGGLDMYIDLGAEKILAAKRGEEKIAVEVKSFVSPSATTEFSTALGQFLKYQLALEEEQPQRLPIRFG